MSQVKCPDCGEMYSEDIQSCPNCGCPNDSWKQNQQTSPDTKGLPVSKKKKYSIVFCVALCVFAVGVSSFLIGVSINPKSKQTAMSVDSALINKIIKDSVSKIALQKQTEEERLEEEDRQAEKRKEQARLEEERKRVGTDIDITLNAYHDGLHLRNIESNYGVYKNRHYHYLESQTITIPEGKVWVFKGFEIEGDIYEAIVGKDDGDGYISGNDRYDLKSHEAFTLIGGTSIRILIVVRPGKPQQINSVCHFKEKDMEYL